MSTGAAEPETAVARRFRGNVPDGWGGAGAMSDAMSGARAAAATGHVSAALGARRAGLGARLAAIGSIPAVPALMWLLPAIALQATLAAAWPASPATFGLSIAQALASFAAILGGGWLIRAAAVELDWNATPVCVHEPPRALVATGPYRFGRHPMYLGAALLLAGTALALGSPPAGGVAAAYLAWLDLHHARAEDAALHARFGPAWRAYAARTRRWL
ncbi:MAG: methyltransferase [Burkholderiales bacterium]|nr:methyltransferase [Burkholderiales bacterium]